MQLLDFFQRVLPPSGVFDVFTTSDRRNHWAHSHQELAETVESLGKRPDIYFAAATFLQEGSEFKGRTQDNVDQLKCFRLDLDAGAKKLATMGEAGAYATQRDALADIVRFSKEHQLPPTLIVSSGEGLHIYYELSEPAIPEQWRPVALAFQAFGTSHGLKIDSSVTADHARVLRPVGTMHPNGKTVDLLKDTGKVYDLAAFAAVVGAHRAKAQPLYDLSINDDLQGPPGPPKTIRKVLQHCGAMQHLFKNQDTVAEPLWRLGIGIAKHTVEGFAAARAISIRHPGYDEVELQEKYDRWAAGPSTCERFAEHAPSQCAACNLRGRIKSPIQTGEMGAPEVQELPPEKQPEPPKPAPQAGKPWDGCIPEKFDVIRTKDGNPILVHYMDVEKENEVGTKVNVTLTIPITHDIFWFGQWADAFDTDDTAQVVVHKMDRGLKRSYLMEQTVVASRIDLTKFLAGKGIHLTTHPKAPQAMEAYAKAQFMLTKALQRSKISDRFGLRILDDGQMVAAQGKYLIHADGSIEEAMLSKSLRGEAENYAMPLPAAPSSRWEPSVWKTHILPSAHAHVGFMRQYYDRSGFEKYQLAITAALASPLMAFVTDGYWRGSTLPGNGLPVAMFSENGGKGKTTVMRCAQLAFGSPSALTKDNDDLNTTALARLARLSVCGTMPINMDEMGDMDAKSLATLIRTVANGSGRLRATKDGGLSTSAPWALVCLIGTNKSQREIIAQVRKESSAEQFRLLEIDVERMPQFGTDAQVGFEQAWKTMGKHSGALGALIHLRICRMGVDKINELVSERVAEAARLVQEIKVESASRFQYRGLGAILTLYDLLEPMGLAPFSREAVVREFLEAYKGTLSFVEENVVPTNGLESLAQMLQGLQSNTIITQGWNRTPGRKNDVTKFDFDIRGRVPNVVHARHVLSQRKTYISSASVKEWCRTNGVRESMVLGAGRHSGVFERPFPGSNSPAAKRWVGPFNLFSGMQENPGGVINCYVVNTAKLAALVDTHVEHDLTNAGNVVELRPQAEGGEPEPEAQAV